MFGYHSLSSFSFSDIKSTFSNGETQKVQVSIQTTASTKNPIALKSNETLVIETDNKEIL